MNQTIFSIQSCFPQDPMHHTEATILVCLAALAVNALVFALIGGRHNYYKQICFVNLKFVACVSLLHETHRITLISVYGSDE